MRNKAPLYQKSINLPLPLLEKEGGRKKILLEKEEKKKVGYFLQSTRYRSSLLSFRFCTVPEVLDATNA